MAEVTQASLKHVEGQVDRCVPEVGAVVGRDATAVERHQGAGFERDHGAASRVVEPHQMPVRRSVLCARWRMFNVMHTAVKASMAAAWLRLPASSPRSP